MKKIIAIILSATYLAAAMPLVCNSTCYADDVIIIRKENKKGQGTDIVFRPNRKTGKIEIRTKI